MAKFQDVKTLQKFASVHASIRLTVGEDGQKPYRNLVQRRGTVRDRGIEGQAVTGFEFVGFVAVPVQQLTFKDVDVFGSRVLERGKDFALVGHGHQKGLNRFCRSLPIGNQVIRIKGKELSKVVEGMVEIWLAIDKTQT